MRTARKDREYPAGRRIASCDALENVDRLRNRQPGAADRFRDDDAEEIRVGERVEHFGGEAAEPLRLGSTLAHNVGDLVDSVENCMQLVGSHATRAYEAGGTATTGGSIKP